MPCPVKGGFVKSMKTDFADAGGTFTQDSETEGLFCGAPFGC